MRSFPTLGCSAALILLGLGPGAPAGWAQRVAPADLPTPSTPRTWMVKLNAFQPLVRGYHVEAEKLWRAHPRTSLGLTLQAYRGSVTEFGVRREVKPDERVRGYGAEVLYRLYVAGADPAPLTGFYVGAGPHLQRFNMHFQADGWQNLLADDGLYYLQKGPVPYTETITRYGGAAVIGYQGPLDIGPLFLDFYVGLGWRQSTFRSAFPESRYRSSSFDYGARGFYLPAGFKLGAAF